MVSLQNDDAAKLKLLDILAFCFNTQKTYGKEPEQIASANRMFQFVLAEYPIEKISAAFKYYLSTNSEMPTPADIVRIIKHGNRPPLDKSIYIGLIQKRERTTIKEIYGTYDSLTETESAYIRDYEAEALGEKS